MPRRKQHCPKRMKWEEEARASGLLKDGEEYDSPCSSPRTRRNSGSVTSRDAGSPRSFSRGSPRESLNSSPSPMSQRGSPPTMGSLLSSSLLKYAHVDADILDFSIPRSSQMTREDILNLSAKCSFPESPPLIHRAGDSPLDLSVPRKRAADAILEAAVAQGKMSPIDLAKFNPWGFPLTSQLASTLALNSELNSLKSDMPLWNGRVKSDRSPTSKAPGISLNSSSSTTSEASRALERMSELSKLGGESHIGSGLGINQNSDIFRSSLSNSSSGRTNAWQSHWLSKGQDATKDVLKCVWCKASFNTLADLTTHMKEAKHCGVNLPPPMHPTSMGSLIPPHLPSKMLSKQSSTSPNSASSSSSDLISSIKETMPLPRKLVRGQDVWLGKGAEQTRQILKCMWCGTSFKSLAEMTRHMQQTQHYTNIISQEQIISWKSPEDKANAQTHVNAVLTCKVCDQAFSSLKELSIHMGKFDHYKEHIMRSITETGSRRRQTREKRKKSLPVRKLLELERAQQELRPSDFGRMKDGSPSKISCEKCGDKIDAPYFVTHIRSCIGNINRDLMKPSMLSPESDRMDRYDSSKDSDSDGKKTPEKPKECDMIVDNCRDSISEGRDNTIEATSPKKSKTDEVPKVPSVLSALEKLIEKSFDSGKRKPGSSPLGSSILRRLGIDEATDYSKPLMDPQLMGMYATFSRLHTGHASSFNLPPSFGPSERNFLLRDSQNAAYSPTADSDTGDTFLRSPLRPNSRPHSACSRDDCESDRSVELIRNEDSDNRLNENGTENSDLGRERLSPINKSDICLSEMQSNYPSTIKHQEIPENNSIKEELRIKDEFKLKNCYDSNEEVIPNVPFKHEADRCPAVVSSRLTGSPTNSSRSGTPHSEATTNKDVDSGALGGLSALLGSVGSEKTGSTNPLAALQKLCDKTDTHQRPPSNANNLGSPSNPGAILAFSWACNDAVTSDSIMKCAYCDTPFISKGAYRHHLSKVHFVKDGILPESNTSRSQSSKIPQQPGTPPTPVLEGSPHSKFLKYTELAKQLSSK